MALQKARGGAVSTKNVAAVAERVKATNDPAEANTIRLDAAALRARVAASGEPSGELVIELAECHAWACYQIGKLVPSRQGKRTDLANQAEDATSPGAPGEVDLDPDTLSRYRTIASLPLEEFEAELAAARAARRPITQTRLLERVRELAPPPEPGAPKAKRVPRDVEKPAKKIVRAAVDKLGDLRDQLPRDGTRDAHRDLLRDLITAVGRTLDVFEQPAAPGSGDMEPGEDEDQDDAHDARFDGDPETGETAAEIAAREARDQDAPDAASAAGGGS